MDTSDTMSYIIGGAVSYLISLKPDFAQIFEIYTKRGEIDNFTRREG